MLLDNKQKAKSPYSPPVHFLNVKKKELDYCITHTLLPSYTKALILTSLLWALKCPQKEQHSQSDLHIINAT